MRNGLQDSGVNYSYSSYTASAQYQQPQSPSSSQPYPYEHAFEQPLQASSNAYQPQSVLSYETSQGSPYQGQQYALAQAQQYSMPQAQQYSMPQAQQYSMPQSVQGAAAGSQAYAEQQAAGAYDHFQSEQLMQQMLAQQQQQQEQQQRQLLLDLYKQPSGQGRPASDASGGRSSAFYTADQYINFLNRQHQDVFKQQQNQTDRGYSFSPMTAYTNGVPATMASTGASQMYSPSANVSRVNYTNGKLSYNF